MQNLILVGLIFIFVAFYLPLCKYVSPAIMSLVSFPLKLGQDISIYAQQFLRFQDLTEENKRLKEQIDKLTGKLLQLQETQQENERLRSLLSLPQREAYKTEAAFLIGKDSSNWTRTILINRGTTSGIKKGMPVVLGANLVGEIIDSYPSVSKVALLVDFNSKIPAKIQRTREDGVVFGCFEGGRNICKMKYVHEVEIGDKVISSGLGRTFPQGLLIGEVIKVEEAKNKLYNLAEIQPAVDFSTLEEVLVITSPVR